MTDSAGNEPCDLAVIGGGINGCGIARDAAGRGLKVVLCEQADLGGGTSSASSKLVHGGLRYLEQHQYKLVRESLREREILLKAAPHLVEPMRFVLPHHPRLRPAWLLRAGLLVYDLLGGKRGLARSKRIDLERLHDGAGLKAEFAAGFEYTDCRVDDARLVVTVAKDARRLGADIRTRTRCRSATRSGGLWEIALQSEGAGEAPVIRAKALVNATGPWVGQFPAGHPAGAPSTPQKHRIKLVQGSHMVVKKWYDGGHAWLLQNPDRRIVFVMPFQGDLAIIGTTETEYSGDPARARITPAEIAYLCEAVGRYFRVAPTPRDVLWSYSGVRPLYDDGADNLREVTRDYVIRLDAADGAPLVTLYGGKLTTFRRLAEAVLAKLAPYFPGIGPPWTETAPLSGGKPAPLRMDEAAARLAASHPFLPPALRARYLSAYGNDVFAMLDGVGGLPDLGRHFGCGLYQLEVDCLLRWEWAVRAEDILWRRTKLGLRFDREQTEALAQWLAAQSGRAGAA